MSRDTIELGRYDAAGRSTDGGAAGEDRRASAARPRTARRFPPRRRRAGGASARRPNHRSGGIARTGSAADPPPRKRRAGPGGAAVDRRRVACPTSLRRRARRAAVSEFRTGAEPLRRFCGISWVRARARIAGVAGEWIEVRFRGAADIRAASQHRRLRAHFGHSGDGPRPPKAVVHPCACKLPVGRPAMTEDGGWFSVRFWGAGAA